MANNLVKVKSSQGAVVLTDEAIIKNTDEFVKDLQLPSNYNYTKAIKSFCLALPDVKGIENATARSVFLAAQSYVNKGLDISKNQCALIMYGDKLTLQKQYQGNVALAKKSNPNIVDITSSAIYDGDKVEIEKVNGKTIVKHETSFLNMNNKVIGAYATIIYNDGTTDSEVMPMSAIEMSWSMTRAGTGVHKKFPSQMARKTVLNKLCSTILNSSIDSESPDYVKDELEQYEENENLNSHAFDESNVIDMDDFSNDVVIEDVVVVEETPKDDAMDEIKAKRQQMLDEIGMDDPLKKSEVNVEENNEVDEVLARFENLKNGGELENEEENYDILDGKHCEKCGKALSETSINYYDKHPSLSRLCYKCSKEEGK
jgi:recombination protein RecT